MYIIVVPALSSAVGFTLYFLCGEQSIEICHSSDIILTIHATVHPLLPENSVKSLLFYSFPISFHLEMLLEGNFNFYNLCLILQNILLKFIWQ